MNKALRKHIASLLKEYPTPQVPLTDIELTSMRDLGTSPFLVSRELGLMQDEGIIAKLSTQPEHWRITSHGEYITSPLLTRIMIYLSQNIIPVIALCISVVGLIISIVATVIAAFALHSP